MEIPQRTQKHNKMGVYTAKFWIFYSIFRKLLIFKLSYTIPICKTNNNSTYNYNGIFHENTRKEAKTKRPICSILSSYRNRVIKYFDRINLI